MKRTAARELAIQLSFAAAASGVAPAELMDTFFAPEHYDTLVEELELCAEYPDDKQMDYIRRLTTLTAENRSEIDGYIERYAKDWKVSRINKLIHGYQREIGLLEEKKISNKMATSMINDIEIIKGITKKLLKIVEISLSHENDELSNLVVLNLSENLR